MFIAKERLKSEVFAALKFGTKVKVTEQKEPFIVTRLGLVTLDELQPHPFQNYYKAGGTDWSKFTPGD